ncbi:His Kinase A (phospho-acceptor) domain-containing protein [Kaistella antarctica]|uniref:histidine kinase n=2 Tax=Kaistella antarctica TaxID=266748 RepID=A0A448NR05_9FLAO|nr:His Kinase A (phospho-acceptor) domain-containing protein [Kaistella antarctica]VEH99174.1 Alkaline phosphatase synthesis sensor protein phoR [Kaistella antarctica]
MQEILKDNTRDILDLIIQNKPIKIICVQIMKTLEAYFKEETLSIALLDQENKTFNHLSGSELPKYIASKINIFLKNEYDVDDKNGLESYKIFPMMSANEKILGVITISNISSTEHSKEEKDFIEEMSQLATIAIENNYNNKTLRQNEIKLTEYAQKLEQKVQQRTKEVMATVQKLIVSNLNLEDQIRLAQLAESEAISNKNIASKIAKNFPNGFVAVMNKHAQVMFAEGDALAQLGMKAIFKEGMKLDDISFFSQGRKQEIKENIRKTFSGEHLSFEIKYKKRYFAVNTAPLVDKNNIITNVLHVYNDISKQKDIEFAIQNALETEQELNDLKSRFISMASHEFRTPLSAILTSAILIGKQNGQGKEEKREKYLAQIERNVNNLTVILNDFLSLSKLEEGKLVAIPERFDLVSYSEKLVKEINMNLKKGQIINVSSLSVDLFVQLDVKLLNHILNNLLSNAIKYSPEESIINLHISKDEENAVIEITDPGIGIPLEEQKHLFLRFFRAKNAANIEGTGLGLNIVKQYTELMDGTIQFKSEIDSGTTVWVSLPIQNKQ